MDQITIRDLYNLEETIAGELFAGKTYPWEVLPEIGAFIVKLGNTLDPQEYEKAGENIWIARSAKVAPTASITGPAIIGKEAEIRLKDANNQLFRDIRKHAAHCSLSFTQCQGKDALGAQ